MNTVIDADSIPSGARYSEEEFEDRRWYVRAGRAIRTQANRVALIAGVLLFLLIFFWPTLFITIHSGEVGVMYRRFAGGTQTDRLLGEGIKFVPPWDRIYIYKVRVQEIKSVLPVLTQEGLSISLDLSIRYHPEIEMVGLLHQRVGEDYALKVVQPEVESAVRTAMAGKPMDEVYGSAQTLIQSIVSESLEQLSQKFIKVDEVLVTQVTLPEAVRNVIEGKMVEKEKAEAYEYRLRVAKLEADRLSVEASGISGYNTVVNASLTPSILQWQGIQATKELATSPNAKTVVIGNSGTGGLPLILGNPQ
jgi:regulator of protease activity HflC (stomatin/prohibitin superfamily)